MQLAVKPLDTMWSFICKDSMRCEEPNLVEKLAFACHLECQLVCCSVAMHLRVEDVMMQIQEKEILHDLGVHFPAQSTGELRWQVNLIPAALEMVPLRGFKCSDTCPLKLTSCKQEAL